MKTSDLNVLCPCVLNFEGKIVQGREQNADFVCNTLLIPEEIAVFHEVFCAQVTDESHLMRPAPPH